MREQYCGAPLRVSFHLTLTKAMQLMNSIVTKLFVFIAYQLNILILLRFSNLPVDFGLS